MNIRNKTLWGAVIAVVVVILCVGGYVHHKKNDINGTYYFSQRDENGMLYGGKSIPTVTIKGDKQWTAKVPGEPTATKSMTIDKKNHTISIKDYGNGTYTYNPKTGKFILTYNDDVNTKLILEKKGSSSAKTVEKDQKYLDHAKKLMKSSKIQGTWHTTKILNKSNMNGRGYLKDMTINGNKVTATLVNTGKHEEQHDGKLKCTIESAESVVDENNKRFPADTYAYLVRDHHGEQYNFLYKNGTMTETFDISPQYPISEMQK